MCFDYMCDNMVSVFEAGSQTPIDKNEAPKPQVTLESKLNATASSIEVTPT